MRKKNYGFFPVLIWVIIAGIIGIWVLGLSSKVFGLFNDISNSPWKFTMIIVAFVLFYVWVKPRR